MLPELLDRLEQRGQGAAQERSRRARCLLLAPDRLEDVLLDLRAQTRKRAQALLPARPSSARPAWSRRAPARSCAPSSARAPGCWRNSTTSGGIVLRRLVSASISPLSTIWTILSWIVAPIPGSSLALPSSASWATGPPRLAHARGRSAVGEHPEGRLAFDLQQVGQQLELLGHLRVARERRRHHGDDTGVRPVVCLPTYNERENLERDGARARRARRLGARDRRQLARTGPASSPTGSPQELDHVEVLHRAAQGGPRPRVPGRVPARARRRRGADPRDGLRLLPRPGRRSAPARGRRGRGPRGRLALRRGRLGAQLGPRPALRLRGRLALRTRAPRRRHPRPDRPASSATGGRSSRRSTSTRSPRSATRSRSRPPTARCAPASASSRCRSPSPTASTAARR